MTGKLLSASGKSSNADSSSNFPNENNSGSSYPKNVSFQTGEEFSPEFLRERVIPKAVHVSGVMDQSLQQDRAGIHVVRTPHVVYEDLTGVLGIVRKDSESGTELSNFSQGSTNKTQLDVGNKCNEHKLSGHPQEKLSEESYVEIGSPVPSGRPIHASASPNSFQPYNQVLGILDSSFTGKMKFLCSFGGRILLRPNDATLRYVGGETRIISIRNNLTYTELVKKTTAICNYPHTIKYQLPGEDLDALISVSSDEDLQHMIEEYHDLAKSSQRLRIFLIYSNDPESPSTCEARIQQSDVDYQYVVAVNGMLDRSPRRSSSRESMTSLSGSNPDGSPTLQRDSPTSVHRLEKRNKGSNSNLKHMVSSNAQIFNASQKGHPLESNATHVVQFNFGSPSKQLESSSPYCRGGFDQRTDLLSNMVLYSDNQDTYKRVSHVVSDPQLQQEKETETSIWNFVNDKSPYTAMSNSSQETQQQQRAELKHLVSNGRDQSSTLAQYTDKQFIEHFQDSRKWMEENDTPLDQDKKSSDIGSCYTSNADVVKHKSNLPKIVCYPNSNLHVPPMERVGGAENSTSPFGSNDKLTGIDKQLSEGYHLDHDTIKLLVDSQKEANNWKLPIPEMTNSNTATQGFPASNPVTFGGMFDQNPLPADDPTSDLGLKDPHFADHSLPGRVRSDVLAREASHDEVRLDLHRRVLDSSNGKVKKESHLQDLLRGQDHRESTSIHSQSAENHDETDITQVPVIVEDVTNCLPPDVHSSSTAIPKVLDEPSDGNESRGGETETDSLLESDFDDGKVDEDDKSGSFTDSAIIEMEAGIYGLQIIRNADLEDLQELGSGTFGTVYHGKWRGTDVAIKRIKKSCFAGRSSEQERLTKDFWREAQILSKLHHPNVVAFYGVVPDSPGGTLATVTEYMANGSLRHVLVKKDRALDRRKKVIIALDAAFGMEYLHLKNIVHFDLKCDNLLVNLGDPHRPVCKVGDFGLSRIKQNTFVSGGVRGTLPWMAPELLSGSSNRVSEKVDIFSFGMAMWEILTGEEPYANMHCGAIIGGIVNNTLRPPIPDRCDTDWRKLMEECWSHDPSVRPSFTEITNRLRTMSKALQPKRYPKVNR